MIRVKIVANDSKKVAKVVIIDESDRVLFLTRSDYHDKHAGELDLPGGHIKLNEPLNKGLEREVKEETGLDIEHYHLYKQKGNKYYFFAKYNSEPIQLSREHTEYGFYSKKDLDTNKKFENIAIQVLEMLEND